MLTCSSCFAVANHSHRAMVASRDMSLTFGRKLASIDAPRPGIEEKGGGAERVSFTMGGFPGRFEHSTTRSSAARSPGLIYLGSELLPRLSKYKDSVVNTTILGIDAKPGRYLSTIGGKILVDLNTR